MQSPRIIKSWLSRMLTNPAYRERASHLSLMVVEASGDTVVDEWLLSEIDEADTHGDVIWDLAATYCEEVSGPRRFRLVLRSDNDPMAQKVFRFDGGDDAPWRDASPEAQVANAQTHTVAMMRLYLEAHQKQAAQWERFVKACSDVMEAQAKREAAIAERERAVAERAAEGDSDADVLRSEALHIASQWLANGGGDKLVGAATKLLTPGDDAPPATPHIKAAK